MDRRRRDALVQTVLQVVAILLLALIMGTIAHKAYGDITRIARIYGDGEFWLQLGRYLFRNLAGGA